MELGKNGGPLEKRRRLYSIYLYLQLIAQKLLDAFCLYGAKYFGELQKLSEFCLVNRKLSTENCNVSRKFSDKNEATVR